MNHSRALHLYAAQIGIALASLVIIAGCNQNDTADNGANPAPAAPPSAPAPGGAGSSPTARNGTDLVAAGKAVYDDYGCVGCHSIGGRGGSKGPELTHVGAEAEHTASWLVAHVKNPKTHTPGSRMPAFAGKISDKDLLALGAYLASLK